ncbi:MAG: flagellar type III secretion system pore protein FliP [Gemmatimonas sp.]
MHTSLGILSALAFVLGLVWIAVWVAKRAGALPSRPKARVQIEVVQRVSIGPKAGLAVVRVGEKVMAVSMGPDGIRPLFELDEADRQRVLSGAAPAVDALSAATSAAQSAITATAPVAAPGTQTRVVTNVLPPALIQTLPASVVRMFQRQTFVATSSQAEMFAASMEQAMQNGKPQTTATPAPTAKTHATERDFFNVLNMTLSGATRLAVLLGGVMLSAMAGSSNLSAQAAPPAAAVTQQPTTQATTQPTTTGTAIPAPSPVVTAPVAPTVKAPAFVVPEGVNATRSRAQVRPAATQSVQAPARTAAQTEADRKTADSIRATARRAEARMSDTRQTQPRILDGSASRNGARPPNGAPAAAAAPIAGGDEALANMLPQMDLRMGDSKDGGLRLSGTVGIVVMMGLLSLVPTLVLMMTGFTRILIVLHFLKQAMGTQSAPPAQLMAAMALLLTGFVMAPTFSEVNRTALEPWMEGRITQVEMLKEGVKPMRVFMMKQMKSEADLRTFVELSKLPKMNSVDDVPLHVLMSAFVTHELREAFKIGFIVYLPFIVIDAVVSSVLMSMGMFMLPPAMISMPFKLLLFVLVDGWGLIIQELVKSFR